MTIYVSPPDNLCDLAPRIIFNGPLSLTAILKQLSEQLTEPRSADGPPRDRLRVSCRVRSKTQLDILIRELKAATPEGLVTLAALTEAVRSNDTSTVSVRIDPAAQNDTTSKGWINAAGLKQLISNQWATGPSFAPTVVDDCSVSPLWRLSLNSLQQCDVHAAFVAATTTQQLLRWQVDNPYLSNAILNVLREGLRNTYEHGYETSSSARHAYAHLMVAPVEYWDETDPPLNLEQQWFAQFPTGTRVLELAVSDAGKGIPFTLHSSFASHARRRTTLGGTVPAQSRQGFQADICKWAFDHKSTRKQPAEFPTIAAQLNWRGLHRALNAVARARGLILLRSGSARVGGAFIGLKSHDVRQVWKRPGDLPGTTLLIRLPLLASGPPATVPRRQRAARRTVVSPGQIIPVSELASSATVSLRRLTLVHTFDTLFQTLTFLPVLYALPPSGISIHLFVRLLPSAALGDLQAFCSPEEAAAFGPPRLVGLSSSTTIQWIFAGLIPEAVRATISELETNGTARPDWDNPDVSGFVHELLALYPSALRRDNEFVHLTLFGASVGLYTLHGALTLAFQRWAASHLRSCVFEEPQVVVRTPGGRLVRRYLPLLRVLQANDVLAEAIAESLAALVAREAAEHGFVVIVADTEASYHIGRILLTPNYPEIRIYLRRPPASSQHAAVVILSDVIWQGEVLRSLAASLRPSRVIVILDISPGAHPHALPDVTCILQLRFNPEEATPAAPSLAVIEVDQVTHLPAPPTHADVASFGFSPVQDAFVRQHPGIFTSGIQTRGGRIHTLAVSTKRLVQQYQPELTSWLLSTIGVALARLSDRDILIATRSESHVSQLVVGLADALSRATDRNMRIFQVSLPFAASATFEVFGRPTKDPWAGAFEIRPASLLPEALRPHPFLIFLDDACVTGRTLRQFLLRVSAATADSAPSAVLLLPIVSRFATDEEIFFSALCKHISSLDGTQEIPVTFRPLLRLFVRSYERLDALQAYRLLISAQRQVAGFDERLERYVERVLLRMREAVSLTADPDVAPDAHPFSLDITHADRHISARSVRIRHLLSLHEANVGVLGAVLTEVSAASTARDWTLLSVLATEPDLLDSRPLKGQCERDVTSLALSALRDAPSTAARSDAIAVLAAQQTLPSVLPAALPSILTSGTLVDECLTLLAATAEVPSRTWRALLEAIAHLTESGTMHSEMSDQALYISAIASSLLLAERASGPRANGLDHIGDLQRHIVDTSYHGSVVQAAAAVTNFLESSDSKRRLRSARQIKALVSSFVIAGNRVLVSGIFGLSALAHSKHNPAAHRELRMAAVRLSTALTELTSFIESASDFSDLTLRRLTELWARVQNNSQRSPSEFVMSRPHLTDRVSTAVERWLPEFFCLPIETIGNIVKGVLEEATISSGPIAEGRHFSVIVAPVPLRDVSRITELLLLDIRQHGRDNTTLFSFDLRAMDGVTCLELTVRNIVREGDSAGKHRSQVQIADIAQRCGLMYTHDPTRPAGAAFESRLVFPGVWYLQG